MSVNVYNAQSDSLDTIAGGGGEGIYKTATVTASAGETSVTILDSNIKSSSSVIPYADNGTSTPMASPKTIAISNGQCVMTFDELGEDTSFYLMVVQGSGSGGGGTGLLPHLVIHTDPNLSVTVTKDTASIIATETSSGVYECDVPAFGTYTVIAIKGSGELTQECIVSSVSIINIYLPTIPDGDTVLPTDDIQKWLNCADIFDKTYTTIGEVLADTTTLSALINDNNASDYLVRSATWATSVCANSTAMAYIGANDYCATTLLSDNTWLTAICNSTYFESVLNVKVPTMTSNTTPSGEVIYGSNHIEGGRQPYYAFDGNMNSTDWNSQQNTLDESKVFIGYKFVNPTIVKRIALCVARSTSYTDWFSSGTFKVMASNDNSVWDTLESSLTWVYPNNQMQYFIIDNDNAYLYYKLVFLSYMYGNGPGTKGCVTAELQFYGRASS